MGRGGEGAERKRLKSWRDIKTDSGCHRSKKYWEHGGDGGPMVTVQPLTWLNSHH